MEPHRPPHGLSTRTNANAILLAVVRPGGAACSGCSCSGPGQLHRRVGEGGTTGRSTARAHYRSGRADDQNRGPIVGGTKFWDLRGWNGWRGGRPHSRRNAACRVGLERRHAGGHLGRRENASRSGSTRSVVTGSARSVSRGDHDSAAEYTPCLDTVRLPPESVTTLRQPCRTLRVHLKAPHART